MITILAKVGYAALRFGLAVIAAPFVLAMILIVLAGEAVRWLELHAVFAGDELARDKAEWKARW